MVMKFICAVWVGLYILYVSGIIPCYYMEKPKIRSDHIYTFSFFTGLMILSLIYLETNL